MEIGKAVKHPHHNAARARSNNVPAELVLVGLVLNRKHTLNENRNSKIKIITSTRLILCSLAKRCSSARLMSRHPLEQARLQKS